MKTDDILKTLKKDAQPLFADQLTGRNRAQEQLSRLEKTVADHVTQFEKLEAAITKLNVAASAAMTSGGDFKSHKRAIMSKKMEKADCQEWTEKLKDELIPQARASLVKAEEELKTAVHLAMETLRDSSARAIEAHLNRGMETLKSYTDATKEFFEELDIPLIAGSLSETPQIKRLNVPLVAYFRNIPGFGRVVE